MNFIKSILPHFFIRWCILLFPLNFFVLCSRPRVVSCNFIYQYFNLLELSSSKWVHFLYIGGGLHFVFIAFYFLNHQVNRFGFFGTLYQCNSFSSWTPLNFVVVALSFSTISSFHNLIFDSFCCYIFQLFLSIDYFCSFEHVVQRCIGATGDIEFLSICWSFYDCFYSLNFV